MCRVAALPRVPHAGIGGAEWMLAAARLASHALLCYMALQHSIWQLNAVG